MGSTPCTQVGNLRAHSDCACMVTWLGTTCFTGCHIYCTCMILYSILKKKTYNFYHCLTAYSSYCSIIMHLYIYILGFYAFQSVFFATIYNYHAIHSSYFTSCFGTGKKMIDILAMAFNFINLYYRNTQFLVWQCHLT